MTTPAEKKVTEKEIQEGIDWIRARPASIHDLMIRFPPSCFVKALIPLHVPSPGKTGQVVSYVESADGNHMVRVRELPDGDIGAECQVDWLEVTGYWKHCTPEFVRLALGRT